MLSNYLKTTLRLMVRERAHTIIHLVGLALGLGTCLVIGQFVRHETSFDGFHENADQLVRVLSTSPGRTPGVNQPSTLGPTLLEELPGVEASVRFALSNPGVSTVLVGYSNMDHLEQSVEYGAKGPLPAEALARLPRAWSTFVS